MFKAHLKNKHSREVEVESSREEEEIDVKAGVSDKAVDNDKKVAIVNQPLINSARVQKEHLSQKVKQTV